MIGGALEQNGMVCIAKFCSVDEAEANRLFLDLAESPAASQARLRQALQRGPPEPAEIATLKRL